MQEDLVAPGDVVQAEHAKAAAVRALLEIVNDSNEFAKERIHAAELLLRYGVRDPYYGASPDPETVDPVDGQG
jgi:predicted component of type VI protein secretion system